MSTDKKIWFEIMKFKKGKLFFPEMFSSIGSSEAIRKSLQRLTQKGKIVRVSQGIYLYPKIDKDLGVLFPTTEKVAIAIAKRDKAKIIPTGVYALNKLGLSTQVPLNAVFLTNGAARTIKIGNRTIKFKKTAPKNLAIKGEITGLIIQALRELGKDNATPQQLHRIKEVLKYEDNEIIKHDAKLAAVWIAKIIKENLT